MTDEGLLYGSGAIPAKSYGLRAGNVALRFDSESGFLRDARCGGEEIIRAVYGAVRNRRWETIAPSFSDLQVQAQSNGFRITFHAVAEDGDVGFEWDCLMEGDHDGVVRILFDGRATRSFLKNRIGLCLLLPLPGFLNRDMVVEHSGGSRSAVNLRCVSAHQPVLDVHRLGFSGCRGGNVSVQFSGEIFEMEDQRNWGDASLKIYSTPQSQGWPQEIAEGTRIRHEIEIRFKQECCGFEESRQSSLVSVDFDVDAHGHPLHLGYQSCDEIHFPSGVGADCFRAVNPKHLRLNVDLTPLDVDSVDSEVLKMTRWLGSLRRHGVRALVGLRLSDESDEVLKRLFARLAEDQTILGSRISWLVYSVERPLATQGQQDLVQALLRTHGFESESGFGADQHFAELNRNLPGPETLAGSLISFPTNPQSHAVDRRSLFENPPSIPMVVDWLRSNGARKVLISPATFQPQLRPWDNSMSTEVDIRKRGLIGAAWAVRLVEQLVRCGELESVTLERLAELGAVFSADAWGGTQSRREDRNEGGLVYPWFHVFADLGQAELVFECRTSDTEKLSAFGFQARGEGRNLVVANLHDEVQRIEVKALPVGTVWGRVLDVSTARYAMQDPLAYRSSGFTLGFVQEAGMMVLELGPYAVIRMRFG